PRLPELPKAIQPVQNFRQRHSSQLLSGPPQVFETMAHVCRSRRLKGDRQDCSGHGAPSPLTTHHSPRHHSLSYATARLIFMAHVSKRAAVTRPRGSRNGAARPHKQEPPSTTLSVVKILSRG